MTIPTFSSSPLEAATWWIDQGFSPIPIRSQSKNPGLLNPKWQDLRIDHKNVAEYFNGKTLNIGILCGLGDAADVDLDWPESATIGPAYLPPTGMVWGHGSMPRSHFLYRSTDAITKQFKDPLQSDEKKATIAELRAHKKDGSIGMQSVVPPGLHHSGERIEFSSADAPALATPETLLAAVSKIAAGALLARHWPARDRHNTMLAVAGVLVRANWPEPETAQFCRALYAAVPSHDPSQITRSDGEVSSTYEKHAAGEEITGFPSLAKTIDPRVLAAALEWLGIKAQVTDWRSRLLRTKKDDGTPGALLRLLANGCIALRECPDLQGTLAYDEFKQEPIPLRPLPWPRAAGVWTDDDDRHFAEWLQLQGIGVTSSVAAEAAETVARENRFHPVRDFLTALIWDGTSRLDLWLTAYFEAPETDYVKAVAARWPIGAVARIFEPGCRMDQVLVFHGEQGIEKSSGLRALFGDAWFSDHLSPFNSKDAKQELLGRWCIELSELSPVRRAETEIVKNFLSTRIDHFRPSYGRRPRDYPRQTVFAATTNAVTPFTDETGNRRFWSVNCGRVDVKALTTVRDQFWAEAVYRYKRGDHWWLDTPALNLLATEDQRSRYEPGPHDDLIMAWVANPTQREPEHERDAPLEWLGSAKGRINCTDVLIHGLAMIPAQIRNADFKGVGRCLTAHGYRSMQERAGKYRDTRYFVLETAEPLQERR